MAFTTYPLWLGGDSSTYKTVSDAKPYGSVNMNVWVMCRRGWGQVDRYEEEEACTCNRSSDQSEWEGSYYCSSDYKSFGNTMGRLYVPMQMILRA